MLKDNRLSILGGKPVRNNKYLAYHKFGGFEKQALSEVIDNIILSSFYGSEKVCEFEEAFADYHGLKFGIATNSGTSALHIAYISVGLKPGDEVIIPANAYISAATAALQVNAIPIFVDIDPKKAVMDPKRIEEKITNRTKIIVPVHLYGQPVNMPAIMKIAEKFNLLVVEDCAQAHGATIDNRLVGTYGHASCYSLCCRKHISCGEGGIVITNDKIIEENARSLVNKGKGLEWWDYRKMGFSYLMTEMQAVIALSSLGLLENEIQRRINLTRIYRERLNKTDLILTDDDPIYKHIYFKFPFLLPSYLKKHTVWFEKAIQAENVVVERCYPVLYHIPWIKNKEGVGNGYPYNFFKHGRALNYEKSNCYIAEDICYRLLAACTGPSISEKEIHETCDAILKVYDYVLNNKL